MLNLSKKLILCLIMLIAQVTGGFAVAGDFLLFEDIIITEKSPLMLKVQSAKLDVMRLNREMISNDLFKNTNFSVFFGVNLVHPYAIDTVKFTLDGNVVLEEQYDAKLVKLLQSGAAKRVYFDNLEEGSHFFEIEIVGREHGRELIRSNSVHFKKRSRSIFIDVQIQDHDKMPPEVLKVIHYAKLDILKMQEVRDVLLKNYKYYVNSGDYLSAVTMLIIAYDKVRKRDPFGTVRYLIGRTYLAWNMPKMAEDIFMGLLEEYQSGRAYINSLYYMGLISFQRKEYNEALDYCSKLLKAAGVKPALLNRTNYLTGEIYSKMADYRNAIRAFNKIEFGKEEYPYAQFIIARSYKKLGDIGKSEEILKELYILLNQKMLYSKLVTLADEVSKSLGYFYIDLGRYDEALGILSKVDKKSLIVDEVLFGIGWVHMQKDESVRGIIMFKNLYSNYPGSYYAGEAMKLTGYLYTKLGRYDKAVNVFNELIRYSKDRIEKLEDFQLNMIETRFDDYIVSSIISTNIKFADSKYISTHDSLFAYFPELLDNPRFMSVINQFKEFVYIEQHLEGLFQDDLDSERKNLFEHVDNGMDGSNQRMMQARFTNKDLSLLLRKVKGIKTEYFVKVNELISKNLDVVKKKSSEYALDATVRIASNLIHDKYGVLP